MSVFETALQALMSDANMAEDIVYRRGGFAAPVSLRAIISRPDMQSEFGEARVQGKIMRVSLQVADAPDLAPEDRFDIDGQMYEVFAAPEKDSLRLTWTVDLELAE